MNDQKKYSNPYSHCLEEKRPACWDERRGRIPTRANLLHESRICATIEQLHARCPRGFLRVSGKARRANDYCPVAPVDRLGRVCLLNRVVADRRGPLLALNGYSVCTAFRDDVGTTVTTRAGYLCTVPESTERLGDVGFERRA
ncbi:MAG TPA: hypothetical protein VN934_03615 [Candidatus Tumulicola sp.]|nr:hypothetical protein [Candidatus Tumulicola sp.]